MSRKSGAERRTDLAALHAAGARFDALLILSEEDVDEMLVEFDLLRKERRSNDESAAH